MDFISHALKPVVYVYVYTLYYVLCWPGEGPEEGIGVGNEEERYTRGNGDSSDEFVCTVGAKTRVRVGLELSKEFEV